MAKSVSEIVSDLSFMPVLVVFYASGYTVVHKRPLLMVMPQ